MFVCEYKIEFNYKNYMKYNFELKYKNIDARRKYMYNKIKKLHSIDKWRKYG